MKRKSLLLALIVLLVGAIVFCVGCSAGAETKKEEPSPSSSSSIGAPSLQPADHEGRFESLGASSCFACHGNADSSNADSGATALPAFHYVDGSVDTEQYSPDYAQCISCHPVGH